MKVSYLVYSLFHALPASLIVLIFALLFKWITIPALQKNLRKTQFRLSQLAFCIRLITFILACVMNESNIIFDILYNQTLLIVDTVVLVCSTMAYIDEKGSDYKIDILKAGTYTISVNHTALNQTNAVISSNLGIFSYYGLPIIETGDVRCIHYKSKTAAVCTGVYPVVKTIKDRLAWLNGILVYLTVAALPVYFVAIIVLTTARELSTDDILASILEYHIIIVFIIIGLSALHQKVLRSSWMLLASIPVCSAVLYFTIKTLSILAKV